MALWILKVFDRVLREVIRWVMHMLGVKEWLVSTVMSMYTGEKTLLYEQFTVTVTVLR